jgi:hypothetical protein
MNSAQQNLVWGKTMNESTFQLYMDEEILTTTRYHRMEALLHGTMIF